MAGVSALYELDIKKIVALSTLSQLGLIITTIGLGLFEVAFFHLLTHAFFKALLFMSVGNIIHLSRDFQDLRKVGLIEFCYPVSLSFAVVANCRLCGFPFMAGFYSKDLILETALRSTSRVTFDLLIYLAVALTVAYTVRFTVLVMLGRLNTSASMTGGDNDWLINSSIAILWPLAVTAGRGLMWLLLPSPLLVYLPEELKNVALTVILLAALISGIRGINFTEVPATSTS
jgi:NADH-ubiquinone oxidoreductase chain 5